MTLVINYMSENFSLIASDTKVTFKDNIIEPYFESKIISLDNIFGWTSGMGLGNFLEIFKEKLSKANISNIKEDIEKIFFDSKSKMIEWEMSEKEIDDSAVSLAMILKNDSILDIFSCYISNTYTDGKLKLFNGFLIFYPSNYTQIDVDEFQNRYDMLNQECNLNKVINQTLEMFNEISTNSPSNVGRDCEIGLLYFDDNKVCKKLIRINMDDYELDKDNYNIEVNDYGSITF
ncbi:hypothetical protein ACSU64_05625 [Bacillaceae bacterium C204]|uniref:hypothetical protein n=1 Tax=Neobacillus sp. 204 TaxID=3383351 RepID=UPI00397A2514